ncbi:MAG TPA: hypothetical protein VFS58_12385 [Steroidobacteraceae bacterium]|nr:hypothetical protein [Steroidobacteraceae bacterium]
MELDELKLQWQELDRKLDRSLALNVRILTETRTRRSKLRLLPLLLLQPLQIAFGFALVIYFAHFWIANLDSLALAASGMALHALSVGLIVDAVVRILLIVRINYAAPVITIQRYLALLRRWEVRSFNWAWVACWLATPAMLLVGVKAVAGVDLWTVWPAAVIWTAIGGVVGAAASIAFGRWARRSRGRLGAAMDRFYVGHSIARAQASLDEIEEFAREQEEHRSSAPAT